MVHGLRFRSWQWFFRVMQERMVTDRVWDDAFQEKEKRCATQLLADVCKLGLWKGS